MSNLDIDAMKISDYNKKYLKSKLKSLTTELQIYSYILSWSLYKSSLSLDNFVLVDYGAGSGMLALLAKEVGIGTVIYNDIYDVSCQDAQQIAKVIGNEADHYVQGDINDMIGFLRKNKINCNAIASYDTIEHIYDIESFFGKLLSLSNGQMSVVMGSGANEFNPLIKRKIVKRQLKKEYKDQEKEYGHKERDCLVSFLKVRKNMVLKYLKELNIVLTDNEIEQLARKTRGKIEVDIQKCVDDYIETGKFPQEPSHLTNTCDPYTGNWEEHFMDPYYLARILSTRGFNACVINGYYGRSKNSMKRFLAKFLNIFISTLKKQGIRVAPFYTIYGKKSSLGVMK